MVLELKNNSVPSGIFNNYEKNIDFQNSCRSFYLHRKKASEDFKETLKTHAERTKGNKTRTSLSSVMDRLRTEMVSLVDQDLSLMEQMLTLNEKIEDLKSKRLYGVSKESLETSVGNNCCRIPNHTSSSLSITCTSSDFDYVDTAISHRHDSDSGYGE